MTRRGDFYEDDEPLADVVAAFEAGEPAVTAAPVRGWTYFLGPNYELLPLTTMGGVVRVVSS